MGVSQPVRRVRLAAISSGGGHWVQLQRLRPGFAECDVTFITVNEGYRADIGAASFRLIPDANRSSKVNLLRCAVAVFWRLLWLRPDVVVSTGAAPGYFGIRIGRLLGARTIWVDSVANVEELSMSGRRIGPHSDLWLTQWPHLARPEGPHYLGSVL